MLARRDRFPLWALFVPPWFWPCLKNIFKKKCVLFFRSLACANNYVATVDFVLSVADFLFLIKRKRRTHFLGKRRSIGTKYAQHIRERLFHPTLAFQQALRERSHAVGVWLSLLGNEIRNLGQGMCRLLFGLLGALKNKTFRVTTEKQFRFCAIYQQNMFKENR